MAPGNQGEMGNAGAGVGLLLPPLPVLPSRSLLPVSAKTEAVRPGRKPSAAAMKTPDETAAPASVPKGLRSREAVASLRTELQAMVEKHGSVLQRYTTRLTCDSVKGREAVQKGFVALATLPDFASLPEEKRVEKLYRAARDAALAQLKNEARRARTPASEAATDPVRLGLNQVQEEMLRLKFECGLGFSSIAAVLHVAPAHVSRLVHAALVQVREAKDAKKGGMP